MVRACAGGGLTFHENDKSRIDLHTEFRNQNSLFI